MDIDWGSFAIGTVTILVFAVIGVLILLNAIMGKAKTQLKFILKKLFSTTSLMMIAIFDLVSAFDPTQNILGLAIAPVAGITIFLLEWGMHDKFKKNKIGISLINGLVATIIIAIPTPVAGLFVTWFGVAGDKKKK